MSRLTANLLLLLTAAIWGAAFVAQATGMRGLSPLWVVAFRNILATATIAPFAARERGGAIRGSWGLLGALAAANACGAVLQQVGLVTASVTHGGFLTSLYVLFTPLIARFALGEAVHPMVWPAAGMAVLGSLALTGGWSGAVTTGDALLTIGAVCWALQVVLTGMTARRTGRPMLIVAVQCAATALAGGAGGIATGSVSWSAVGTALPELLYLGVLSSTVGFSLQAIAQRHTRAPDAAVLLAAEAPFAALAGAVLLGERLTASGWAGCALILSACLAVQLAPEFGRLQRARRAPSTG